MNRSTTTRCIDCGRRTRTGGPRCRSCRRDNELGLVDGKWVTGPHGIKHWQPDTPQLAPTPEETDEPVLDPSGDIVDIVVHITARHLDVTPESIYARDLRREVALARHVASWVAVELGISSAKTGRSLGRDHSTVLHGRKRVNADDELLEVARAVLADYHDRKWTEAA